MSPGDEHAGHLQEGKFSKEKMDGRECGGGGRGRREGEKEIEAQRG